jgi:3-oxoacyl-[acyl-carrier protein] reductase
VTPPRVLVLGARGAIGAAVANEFDARGWAVLPGTHAPKASDDFEEDWVHIDEPDWAADVRDGGRLDAVVFAQGANVSGGLVEATAADFAQVWEANVRVIVEVMSAIVGKGLAATSARVVVISSVWQLVARSGKIAYTTSKAAVGGLVRALAVELAPKGVLVNAVLPGVLDTPMTRAHLSASSIERVTRDTPAGRLATVEDVARATYWLASEQNTAVTGQSVSVDLGWTIARYV